MSSVAEILRKESRKQISDLSVDERIRLALELGDFDVEIFCSYQGLGHDAAIEKIRQGRHIGRRRSVASGSSR